jgi:hypothetical protein
VRSRFGGFAEEHRTKPYAAAYSLFNNAKTLNSALARTGHLTVTERLAQIFDQRIVTAFNPSQAPQINLTAVLQNWHLPPEIIREAQLRRA